MAQPYPIDSTVLHNSGAEFNTPQSHGSLLIVGRDCAETGEVELFFSSQYNTTTSDNFDTALAVAQLGQVDLILLDVDLPGSNGQPDDIGLALCETLQTGEKTRHIPIIILTQWIADDTELVYLNAGAVDFITKPAELQTLRLKVENHMKLCQHRKALVDFSYTDTLTGLADRRYSQSILTRECHSAVRGEHPLSIALLEINDFKHYIERFGDQQGDAYLAHVAKIFNDRLRRQNDLLARFADDDFLLILPHTDYQGAQVAVNNLLQALPQQQLSSNALGNSDNISINVGIASYSPHLICDDEPSAAWLLDEADQQLFAAKKKTQCQ